MAHIDEMSVNAIRVLSADAIQKANSGHPGLPLGAAPMAYELWAKHMKHNPANPDWADRDRFVLSKGHCAPSFPADMVQCCYTLYFICLVMEIFQLRI